MTTPDGRDARSGETIGQADPSVDGDASASQAAPEQMPRTPDTSDATVTEQAPRTDEQDPAPSDADESE